MHSARIPLGWLYKLYHLRAATQETDTPHCICAIVLRFHAVLAILLVGGAALASCLEPRPSTAGRPSAVTVGRLLLLAFTVPCAIASCGDFAAATV
jgi:hypothetical protein